MDYQNLTREDLIRLLQARDGVEAEGIRLIYNGQTAPWRIIRKVRPRRQKIEASLSCGSEADQNLNLIVEGENLQAMVSLYKFRGQVDLILTDPPYNTGKDFRYNDKWDEDPNDPDVGRLVAEDDGSRHSKWLRFMEPRLWMMREMLKPGGVLAICIDHRELFRLGVLMDGIFGQRNRLGVINWQKSSAPRSDNTHISTSTEYVLVYAKDKDIASTTGTARTQADNRRYNNWDKDPEGAWREGNLTARSYSESGDFGIQSPFTGDIHYPAGNGAWRHPKKNIKGWLEAWGSKYVERDIGDGKRPALMLKTGGVGQVPASAREAAFRKLKDGPWPFIWFGVDGEGRPRTKTYLEKVRAGKVPMTFWADDDYSPTDIGSTSWNYKLSGRTNDGLAELSDIVGAGHGFDTVKPLKLIKKIIQIWCPPGGIVLDPFAGSGTTAHAILELNAEEDAARRFVLIEQGRPNRRDDFARTLTAVRVGRAISGERVVEGAVAQKASPLGGGFRFSRLSHQIDGEAVLALEREEMIELLVTSHWDYSERASSYLKRLPAGSEKHLFGIDGNNRGYFLVWDGPAGSNRLNRASFKEIAAEANSRQLRPPFHVYARLNSYDGPNVEFYQIPDRILEQLGVNLNAEPFDSVETYQRSEGE